MPDPLPDIEPIIDARAAGVAEMFDKAALDRREILAVESAAYVTAGYRVAGSGGQIASHAQIDLRGTPSPSSSVTQGSILIRPRTELRAPFIDSAENRIVVEVAEEYLEQVLAQLRHGWRHLWIGFFAGGHVYADLHTED